MVVAALLYFWAVYTPSSSHVNMPMPEFTLRDSSGAVYRLSDYQGRPVLVHFWASWCGTCVGEMPEFNAFAARHKGDLPIIGISEDASFKDLDTYIAAQPLSFTTVLDEHGTVADDYGTFALPETYLISAEGRLLKKYVGPVEWSEEAIWNEIASMIHQP